MSLFIQVFIVILLIILFVVFFRKKFTNKLLAIFSILIAVFGLIAFFITNSIPVPTDKVIITALNEKNDESSYTQVAVKNVINVDGKDYIFDNPSDGKWFWRGEEYWWRPPTDSRIPNGLTDTITLNVPIGRERYIKFCGYPNRGIAKVTMNDYEVTVDSYNTDGAAIKAFLPSTSAYIVYLYKIGLVILDILIVLGFTILALRIYKAKSEVINKFFLNNYHYFIFGCIALCYFIFCVKYSSLGTLWDDEIWSLGWYYDNALLYDSLWHHWMMKLWLKIAPYGQMYLLIVPEILCAVSVYIAGLTGNLLRGKRFGVILAVLVSVSSNIIYQCSYEIRPYAWVFASSVASLYLMLLRNKKEKEHPIKYSIIFSVAIVLLFDSHSFGLLFGLMLLGFDFIALLCKKLSEKCFVEFVFPIGYLIYYVTVILKDLPFDAHNFAPALSLKKVVGTIEWMCSYNAIEIFFLFAGISSLIIFILRKFAKHEFNYKEHIAYVVFLTAPTLILAVVYIYSSYINPENSLFIDRYFSNIVFCVISLIGIGIDDCISLLCKNAGKNNRKAFETIMCVFIVIMFSVQNLTVVTYDWCPYPASDRTLKHDLKAAGEYIQKQGDIYAPYTVVAVDANRYIAYGMDYYFTRNKTLDPINVVSKYSIPENITDYSVIYVMYAIKGPTSSFQNILDEFYILESDEEDVKVRKYRKIE